MIIKNQVLQITPFDCHNNHAVDGVQRGENPFGTRLQLDAILRAAAHTNPASQAHLFVQPGLFTVRVVGVIC